jgi:TetR/AcrR family transcriptional repressor of nem operon
MSAEETKIRLLETALELIWQSNYNSVGVNEICKQAGVTKGGFYHHFESKASLFCAASEYYWNAIKRDLDSLLSPVNTPLEQLENLIHFIFRIKFGDDPSCIRGCPFFSAGLQTGCEDSAINDNLFQMSQNCVKYNLALVRALSAAGYLEGEPNVERVARLLSQYVQGVSSYARVSRCQCMETVKLDLAEAFYRLLGLKREYWFAAKPTWGVTAELSKAVAG